MSNDNPNDELKFEIGEKVAGYKIVEKIDEGGFGQVFKVSKDKNLYAMKIENNAMEGGSAIKLEISVFKGLLHESVFPRFLSGGKRVRYHYLVLELLGDNLRVLKSKSPQLNGFSEGTWSRVGIQCLFALKTMHDNGFVHRDVKPNNFAIGLDSRCRFILAFDFGLARKFVKKTEKKAKGPPAPSKELVRPVLPKKTASTNTFGVDSCNAAKSKTSAKGEKWAFRVARPHTDFRGTHQYASPNAHMLKELGRVDDVWSLLYMVAELFTELPWSQDDATPVDEQKDKNSLREIFEKRGVFDPLQLKQLDEIEAMMKTCDYYSHPDYDMVYRFLLRVMEKEGRITWDSAYDWETVSEVSMNKKRSNVMKSGMRWQNPGNFFKIDKWATLEVPGGRSPASSAPSSVKQSSKKLVSKKIGSKRMKVYPSRQKASCENSVGDGCETPIVKSIIQKKAPSREKP